MSINDYFQDSTNLDIFDQLSSKLNITTEQNVSSPQSSMTNVEMESSASGLPTICKMFSDGEVNNASTNADKFFDNLGTRKVDSLGSMDTIYDESTFLNEDITKFFTNDELNEATNMFAPSYSSSGEADRRRDAWIPSIRTKQALMAANSASTSSYTLDNDQMTMPGVLLREDMVDNVHEAVNHYLGEVEAAERKVLTANDVTQDERGLRDLIQAECYRAAVNLTSRLLAIYGQGDGRAGCPSKHTLHSIQLWFTRISLLVKLKSWSVAWAEAEPWWDLDRPDLYFQFYSELYGGRPGTIVPFSFRLLLSELPQYVQKPQEAFKRLFSVLSTVRTILKNLDNRLREDGSAIEIHESDRGESKKLWKSRETRILHSILNLTFQQKEFSLSANILEKLIDDPFVEHGLYYKRALMSSMGRVFLQLGNLIEATKWFERAKILRLNDLNKKNAINDFAELVDLGTLSVAQNEFEKGCEYFKKASLKDPTNMMVKNNIAVCLLYCGKHKEAINLLEAMISTNPSVGLNESLLLNLCNLYELESSTAVENKYKILKLLSKYKGDAISLHCLKLPIK